MPTLHNPLGWVMTAADRDQLVEIARRHGLLIIEDAAYAYLAEDPPPPLAALAPEITVYVSGLSKSVATGLRVGFVVGPARLGAGDRTRDPRHHLEHPRRDDRDRLPLARRRHGRPARGRRSAADAEARQSIAREGWRACRSIGHPSSYFVWLPLAEDARADRVAATADAPAHLGVHGGTVRHLAHVPQAIRLALGSTDLDALRRALGTVRRVVDAHTHL